MQEQQEADSESEGDLAEEEEGERAHEERRKQSREAESSGRCVHAFVQGV